MIIIKDFRAEFNFHRRLWLIIDDNNRAHYINSHQYSTLSDIQKSQPGIIKTIEHIYEQWIYEYDQAAKIIQTLIEGARLIIVGGLSLEIENKIMHEQVAWSINEATGQKEYLVQYKGRLGCSCNVYGQSMVRLFGAPSSSPKPAKAPVLEDGQIVCSHIAAYLIYKEMNS